MPYAPCALRVFVVPLRLTFYVLARCYWSLLFIHGGRGQKGTGVFVREGFDRGVIAI